MGVYDEFSLLPTDEVDEDTSAVMRALERCNESARRGTACRLLISVLLNILLFLSLLIGGVWSMAYSRTCPTDLEQPVWSPAASTLRNIHEIFPNAFSDKTQFMGAPSPKLDRIWETHYDLTTGISKQEAEQLTVPTIEFPEGSGSYIVLLDIFHSLHCLNSLRKSLHPEYYPPSYLRHNMTEEDALRHTDHCVEHIRLALWCGADISPISYRLGEDGELMAMHGYPHTCRDSQAILDWANARKV